MNKPEFFRTATSPFAERYDNFIGGRWVEPKAGRYFSNTSPVNGQVLCEIARSDAADVEAALDAAHAAKDAWGRTSPAERALILNRIADRMEENLALLARAETWDNGKPIRETTAADLPLGSSVPSASSSIGNIATNACGPETHGHRSASAAGSACP